MLAGLANELDGLHGPLFERPFKRKLIKSEDYLKQTILYIHNNPVHHEFCNHPVEYPWSSYLTFDSTKPSKLEREQVFRWFKSKTNFMTMHNHEIDVDRIGKWLQL